MQADEVGFTGTAKGMTSSQKLALSVVLNNLEAVRLHHGDCIGADAEAHHEAEFHGLRVVIYPPEDNKARAWCKGDFVDEVKKPKPYLLRNHDIVDATKVLIGTPFESVEPRQTRAGGTWATIRYARKVDHRRYIIWPDGSVTVEG